jgi:hypothetical protein
MKCFSLILGARNTPTAGKKFSKRDDAVIRDITARHFPEGFTVLNADGAWFDRGTRKFIEEESRQLLVCTARRSDLRVWCQQLGVALQQKELLIVEMGRATSFIVKAGQRRRKPSRESS